ncbi:helix-turn-helix domain-containing protein [Sinomicrobium weinanense]|uniref:Helix-turn-helix transcriptional regulator n=1 Tax=Sinomicrobium weinanense TaxID=2842200 RepID=A0A926JRM1_9FLAO|nr:helix-turn-helix domain-containing protein [Sinomicrobium weinanense]MBC9796111.1 helix-turn-helix transcriptional regulator [Sinomicrobium weinanense]MBU3124780.1 AraC family transcriptional regulator [Sinomicrobium weinanense]
MEYIEYKPHPSLSEYIECFWATDVHNTISSREVESFIPDGNIELVFNFGDDLTEFMDGKRESVRGSHVSGIRNKSAHVVLPERLKFFCVRFKPGGSYPFFGIPAHLFAYANYPLDAFLGREYRLLEEQVYEAPDDTTRIGLIENFLLKKLQNTGVIADYYFVKSCMHSLFLDTSLRINELSRKFHSNYKTIERKFKKVTGLSPSELVKIKRVNNAVQFMHSSNAISLTETAYACGYYDQSHFIREFKQVTELAPREFLKKEFAVVQSTEGIDFSCRIVVEIVQFLQSTDSYVCLKTDKNRQIHEKTHRRSLPDGY